MNFYPCNQLGDPSPSTVGFLPFPPKKDGCKGAEGAGGLEKRLDVVLTCRSRALEKAGMWQERMGHQNGALLFLSSSGQSQPGWFSSPAASGEVRFGQNTPQHLPLSLWDPKISNLGCRVLISNPKISSSVDLGNISPLFSKLLRGAQPSNCLKQQQKQPQTQIIYM